ncbi:hypothetical protein ACOMHN_021799 [Nucella lapillus]
MAEGEETTSVVAKYDYTAENGQELSVRKAERLVLLDSSKDWWRVRNADNKQGYVPSNYMKIVKRSMLSSLLRPNRKKDSKHHHHQHHTTTTPSCPPPSLNGNNPQPRGRNDLDNTPIINQLNHFLPAVVKFNYTAQRADELSLAKGERILVTEKSSDGWWKGQREGVTQGWFPSNYVEEEEEEEKVEYDSPVGPDHVLALYTFTGNTSGGELSFEKGEKLEVMRTVDEDTEWWQARNSRGEIGLVPKNYVTPIAPDQGSDRTTTSTTSSSTPHSQSISSISNSSLPGGGGMGGVVGGRRQFQVSGPLAEKDWYFGKITRQQCEDVLTRHADNGDFLIRDSESTVGHYTVVLKATNRNKHFRVKVSEGVYEIGQQKFGSLEELMEHYKKHPIFKQDPEKLYLVKPFTLPSPTSSDTF